MANENVSVVVEDADAHFVAMRGTVPKVLRGEVEAVSWFWRSAREAVGDEGKVEALRAQLHESGQRVRSADAPERTAGFVALAEVIRRHDVPVQIFEMALDGMVREVGPVRVSTWEELVELAKGRAAPVGRLALWMAGHRWELEAKKPEARVSMSDALCTAVQLTRYWQDVRRDVVERDRVNLPFKLTGLSGETLRAWAAGPGTRDERAGFAEAMRPLVERTRSLLRSAEMLPTMSAPWLARSVRVCRARAGRLLDTMERREFATLWDRPGIGGFEDSVLRLRVRAGFL